MQLTFSWQQADRDYDKVVSLKYLVALGRSAECNVVVKAPTVSRQHALVYMVDQTIYLKNVSRTNGVKVGDGALLDTNETAVLQEGDQIMLGDVPIALTSVLLRCNTNKVRCTSCEKSVPAYLKDCHWCGTSLAFAETFTYS